MTARRFESVRTVLEGLEEVPLLDAQTPTLFALPKGRAADLRPGDVAVIGIPQGSMSSPGRDPSEWPDMGLGPDQMRRESMRYSGYLPEYELDVFERVRILDLGNVDLAGGDEEKAIANTAAAVKAALATGARVITIGGAVPTSNYGAARGVAEATDGAVGVISIDAHGDAHDEFGVGRVRVGPGTWQRRLWERFPNLQPARHVEIGMRGPRNHRGSIEAYRKGGAKVVPAATVRRRGIEAVCAESYPHAFAGAARVWFSLCMDVMDIGAVHDWGDEPLGLSGWDMAIAAEEAGRMGVDVLSLQFVAPDSPASQRLACYLCLYQAAGWIEGGFAGKV